MQFLKVNKENLIAGSKKRCENTFAYHFKVNGFRYNYLQKEVTINDILNNRKTD
jgi:hypothetical protein